MISTANMDGQGSISFFGPNMNGITPIKKIWSFAAPTRMADGRIAIVGFNRILTILPNGSGPGNSLELPGQSIVSAAASRNHLFVATAGSFITYDPTTWQKLAEIFWMGGGTVTPVIGPYGHVYGHGVEHPVRVSTAAADDRRTHRDRSRHAGHQDRPGARNNDGGSASVSMRRSHRRACACSPARNWTADDCGKSASKRSRSLIASRRASPRSARSTPRRARVRLRASTANSAPSKSARCFDEIECKN
jgi:hypothetical protein